MSWLQNIQSCQLVVNYSSENKGPIVTGSLVFIFDKYKYLLIIKDNLQSFTSQIISEKCQNLQNRKLKPSQYVGLLLTGKKLVTDAFPAR